MGVAQERAAVEEAEPLERASAQHRRATVGTRVSGPWEVRGEGEGMFPALGPHGGSPNIQRDG